MASAGLTDVGKIREKNEDSFLVNDELGLYLVADGMGGHIAGDVASRMATEEVESCVRTRLAKYPPEARTPEIYLEALRDAFQLANRAIYAVMTSRPHATMKHNPPLQRAAHKVITEAMRIFCQDIQAPAERRRAVMKVYITLYGGISLYATWVLDQPSEKALIAELSAMNAGK